MAKEEQERWERDQQERPAVGTKSDALRQERNEEAKKLIIRSVTVQDAEMDTVFQLPATTWIGGKVN